MLQILLAAALLCPSRCFSSPLRPLLGLGLPSVVHPLPSRRKQSRLPLAMASSDQPSAAADAPAPCCPPGSWGAPLDAKGPPTARGKSVTLRGADGDGDGDDGEHHHRVVAYVTGVAASKKAIIVFTDVWGVTDRAKAICDHLADSLGYRVIMPDCLRGETKATNSGDMAAWLSTYPYSTVVSKDIDACVRYLAAEAGVDADDNSSAPTVVGALGFCWGAWALAKASSEGAPLRCGVGIHPSTAIETKVFGRDEKAMLEAVTMPVLVLPAGNDDEKVKPGGEYAAVLEARGGKSVEFPDMVHGWSCRGDMTEDAVRRDAEKALSLAVDFFDANMR